MCGWITDKGGTVQDYTPNKVITETNQVILIKGKLYLVPRNTVTDDYTTPFGINKSKWDTRPSHLHDIGCKYHQVIEIDLPLEVLFNEYIYLDKNNKAICKDIPIEYLKVVDISFDECNNLLYEGMNAISSIPNYVCKAYRLGVNFNINWLFTGKNKIDLNTIYKFRLYT